MIDEWPPDVHCIGFYIAGYLAFQWRIDIDGQWDQRLLVTSD